MYIAKNEFIVGMFRENGVLLKYMHVNMTVSFSEIGQPVWHKKWVGFFCK